MRRVGWLLLVCVIVFGRPALSDGWRPVDEPGVRVFVERSTEGGLESLTIFGTGVALWRGEVQFRVADADIERVIDAFDDFSFDEMADMYGSGKKWLERRVSFRGGGRVKEVVQLVGGEHSASLAALADRIFAIADPPSRAVVGAADLKDALGKVASGELAPEALSLIVHFKPGVGPLSGEGFLLRLDEGAVTTRPYSQGRYLGPLRFELPMEGVRDLAEMLLRSDLESFPANLFALHYSEVVVRALRWKKSVLAQPFAGMTPTTHGEKQGRFDRLFEAFRALHREALSKGRPLNEEKAGESEAGV